MFPDMFPDSEPTRVRRETCCELLTDSPPAVSDRLWMLVHSLCHGRVPFTVDGFASVTTCTNRQAEIAVRAAYHRDWLARVPTEPYVKNATEPLWVGCLPRRR